MTFEQITALTSQVNSVQELNALRSLSANDILQSIPTATLLELYQPQQDSSLGYAWIQTLERHFGSPIVLVDKANVFAQAATGKVVDMFRNKKISKLTVSIAVDGVVYYPVYAIILAKQQALTAMDYCPLNPTVQLQGGIGTKGIDFTNVSEKVRHILHIAVCWKKSFSLDAFGVATQIKTLLKSPEDQVIAMLESEASDAYAMYLDDCRSAISYVRRLELWQQMELAKKVPEKPAVSTGPQRDGKRVPQSSEYALLTEKLRRMNKQRILETRVDEKFRLDQLILECQAEINALKKAETEE